MRAKLPFYALFLVILTFQGLAQVNLVPNYSFETDSACPTGSSQIYFTGSWRQPTQGTSDYYKACGPAMSVPSNSAGYQAALNGGNSYAGIIAFAQGPYTNGGYREYIQTQLTSPLTAGQSYDLSFFVSLGDSASIAVNNMGACVTQTPVSLAAYFPLNLTPQVSNPSNHYLNNSASWVKISGCFIASGGEEYITIGNFMSDALTATMAVAPITAGSSGIGITAYYYIDEVSLSPSGKTCELQDVGIRGFKANAARFYYSPAHHKLFFENKEPAAVMITDLYGSRVKTSYPDAAGEIDVSDLQRGCYFVSVNGAVKKILVE